VKKVNKLPEFRPIPDQIWKEKYAKEAQKIDQIEIDNLRNCYKYGNAPSLNGEMLLTVAKSEGPSATFTPPR
jgi:hypothetical protein